MRTIASLAVIAALTLTSAGALSAQGNPPGGMRGRGPGGPGGPAMLDRALLKGITLSESQQASLKQLHDADRANMQATMQQDRAEMDAIRAARESGDTAKAHALMDAQRTKMDARRDAQIAAIRVLLSGDQLTLFDANVTELKKRGPGRRGGPPGRL